MKAQSSNFNSIIGVTSVSNNQNLVVLGTGYVHTVFKEYQGLHIHMIVEHIQPPIGRAEALWISVTPWYVQDRVYATFISSKKNSRSDLITHAWMVLKYHHFSFTKVDQQITLVL